jgi:hypothetical protein
MNVEESIRKSATAAQKAKLDAPVDEALLNHSIEEFRSQEKEDKRRDEGKLAKEKRQSLEEMYVFYLTCFQIDANSIRALCKFFWRLCKKQEMSSMSAAVLTNTAPLLLKARTSEFLLETEGLREKLAKEPRGVLLDSDPVWRIRKDWLSGVFGDNTDTAEVQDVGQPDSLSLDAFQFSSSHF